MSANRPKRAAAADADWLIRQRKELIASASSASTGSAASHLPFDSDDDDESYVPSVAAHKRQRTASGPLHSVDEPLPPAVAFSTSTGGSSRAEYDIWDEHEQDSRHQRSRATGCFVIAPIVTQPRGFRSEQATREAEQAQQTLETEQKPASGSSSKPAQRGKRTSAAAASHTATPVSAASVSPLTLLSSGVTAVSASEPLSAVQSRDTALNDSLESLSTYMSSLLSSSHRSTFTAMREWILSLPPPAPYNSLNCLTPSAFLYAGVDADDQPLLFSQLSSHILDHSTTSSASSSSSSSSSPSCLPLLLSSSQCQTVEKAVRHILVSYMTTYPSTTTSSSRSRRSDHNAHFLYSLEQSAARHKQLTKEMWPSLADWWKDKCSQMPDSQRPTRLLLIFTDPHAFAPATLSKLLYVLMCHEQLRQLPWVWMFGLGVDARVMYGLDERVTSRMRVANFRLASSSSLLSPLLASLMLSPSASLPLPLLSPATLNYVAMTFASDHTSLSSFALALRALMCYYYSSVPFSDVVHAWITGKGPQRLQSMTNAELMEMQRVYGEDGLGGDSDSDITYVSAADYRESVLAWLKEWDVERALFLFGCHTLWRLVSAVVGERTDMDTDERGVLLAVYESREQPAQSIESLPLYQAVLTALRSHQSSAVVTPLKELVTSVREWCEQQADVGSTSLSRLADEVQASLDQLLAVDESAVATVSLSAKPVRAKTARERRVALSGGIDAARKQHDGVRDEVARCLTTLFDTLLPRLQALPLAQLFICHSPELPSLMSFQQRYAVIDAITAAASSSSASASSSSPLHSALLGPHLDDMRVVLQLYDESGVTMHLLDTFTTFANSRHPSSTSNKRNTRHKGRRQNEEADGYGEEKGEADDGKDEVRAVDIADDFMVSLPAAERAELYLRFSACIDALRWCGFIRPVAGKRGSDEMIKLVFNTK